MNLDSTTILLILIPITLVIGAIATAKMIKRNANDDSLLKMTPMSLGFQTNREPNTKLSIS